MPLRVVVGAFWKYKGASLYKTFTTGLRPWKNHTTALRAREMHFPLWWLAPLPSPRSSVGRQKESALMGRLGALLRPTWRSYAGPPQWHYKAPLCCERLMKGMLRGALFCPLHRGKSGAAWIGGGERSEPITRMPIKSYDTESKSRNVLASPLGEEGHEVAKGVQANWIHRGAPRPANPVRRHPAKSVWTVVR